MSPAFWTYLAVGSAIAFVSSLAFRRGRLRRMARVYRNTAAPAVIRNLVIASPLLSLLMIPLLAITAPLAWHLAVPDVPERVIKAYAFGALGYALLVGGGALLLLSHPARWLIPAWLSDEDLKLGYRPPKADWFDNLLFLLGFPLLFGGAVAVFAAIVNALGA
jgi:hypothetical protein